jgi:hypothetical protein
MGKSFYLLPGMQPIRLLILIAIISIVVSSCMARSCKVKNAKQKWKYYNSLQFGGGTSKKKK